MKPHTSESCVGLKNYTESQQNNKKECYKIGDMVVNYSVVYIPEEYRPFSYAIAASVPPEQDDYEIAVSDDVPENLRGLWAWHELHDFKCIGHEVPGRCSQSEAIVAQELSATNPSLLSDYLNVRIPFYESLAEFMKKDIAEKGENSTYHNYDVDGCFQAIKLLLQYIS